MRHLFNALIVLCLLLPGVFGDQDRGGVRRFLRWRPIAYTGLVSYGVYLWHQGFTDKAMTWTNSTPLHANFVLVTALAVALQRRRGDGLVVLLRAPDQPPARRPVAPLARSPIAPKS